MAAVYNWVNSQASLSAGAPAPVLIYHVPAGWSVQRVMTFGGYSGLQTFNFASTAPKAQGQVEARLLVGIGREGGAPALEILTSRTELATAGFTRVNDTLPVPLSNANDGVLWWQIPSTFWQWDANVRQDSPTGKTYIRAEFAGRPKSPPSGANYVWPQMVTGDVFLRCLISKPA